MNPKIITNFASQLGIQIRLDIDFILEKNSRFFLVNSALQELIFPAFYYVGIYLGKIKNGKFFPSFNLLRMFAKKNANRVVVDRKAAWLFICGRDILRKSILHIHGPGKKNTNTLILNEFGECLGFGRIVEKIDDMIDDNVAVIRNVSDIGDFLRRER